MTLTESLLRYVDQLGSVDDTDVSAVPPLMCLVEDTLGGMGPDERVSISMISVSASTGDVVWDHFEGTYSYISRPRMYIANLLYEDNHMRIELEVNLQMSFLLVLKSFRYRREWST